MASKPAPFVPSPLVGKGFALIAEIAGLMDQLKAVEDQLVAEGPGRYRDEEDDSKSCTVVAGSLGSTGAVTYALPEDGLERARELAGDDFRKLFDREEVFSPTQGFELLAPKLLTPARAEKIVQLCLVAGREKKGRASFVNWK